MKQNVFVRVWKKICKFTTDTIGELKKVVWTPKDELKKSTKLVIFTVLAMCIAIALIDLGASWVLGKVAGLVG